MLKNSFYKRPPQQSQNKISNFVESNPTFNQQVYQVVPIISHTKNNSYHNDRNNPNNSYNYQYITPSASPIKIQPNSMNMQSTPSRVTSAQMRNPNTQYICRTAEKRNGNILPEKDKILMNQVLVERNNNQVSKREKDVMDRNEHLSKKLEILLKENRNLNAVIHDMGVDLLETKQKLAAALKNDGNLGISQSNEDLEAKIMNLTKENDKLIKMIEIQNREENSLRFLEEKIDSLLVENNKLNMLLKKEKDTAHEYKRKFADINRNNNLEYENKILEIKMQELQKKLEVIFDDNDKLENILKAHEVEYDELKVKYENEVAKNSHQVTQINELLIKIKDLKDAYKAATLEDEKKKIMNIIEDNNILEERNGMWQNKLMTLLEENNKLNECLNQIIVSMDEEKKLKGMITPSKEEKIIEGNEKLRTILEDNLGENEKNGTLLEENQKLKTLLEEKETSENNWKNKYLELEKKIKSLF